MPSLVRVPAMLVMMSMLCLPSLASAQEGTIRGRVADATGTPIPQATIALDATAFRAVSNERGAYVIAGVPEGSYVVRVRRIGFVDRSRWRRGVLRRPGHELAAIHSLVTLPRARS